jgi:hypothetical protein
VALVGLDLFSARFAPFSERYALIGGAACFVAMDAVGAAFRTTKDLDIVLCLEGGADDFARTMWSFIRDGGYELRESAGARRQYYRFAKPKASGFPAMIELFSRAPDALLVADSQHIVPAVRTIDEDGAPISLSAILLDDAYYDWIRAGRQTIKGLSVVRAEHLIPLKAKAWLDLKGRADSGAKIDQHDIRKHRNDVIRLYTILDPDYRAEVPPSIRADMSEFLSALATEPIRIADFGLRDGTKENLEQALRERYCPTG